MRQVLTDAALVAIAGALAGIMMYAAVAPDPVQAEIGRRAAAEARGYALAAQQRCADEVLRPHYAAGDPTDEQVAQAYRDCGGAL
jgi:hypothetical protein